MQIRNLLDQLDQLTEQTAPPVNMTGKWPASPAEIKAFQTANGLKADGLIGKDTLAALNKAGAKAPPGFVPVGPKQAKKAGTDASGKVPIPSGGVAASTPAQAVAANAQQAPQGSNPSDVAAATPAPAAPTAEPIAPNVTPWGGTTAGTPPAGGTPFTAPTTAAPAATTTQSNTTQPAAQAATPSAATSVNPWEGSDPAKAAAWAALSPEDQKWIGKADPTDQKILARAPSKGGFLGSITPNFMKKQQPAAAPAPTAPAPAAPSTSTAAPATMAEDFDRVLELAGIKTVTESKKKVLSETVLNEGVISGAARALGKRAVRPPIRSLRKPSSPNAPKPGAPATPPATPPAGAAPKPGAAPAAPTTPPAAPGSTTGNFKTRSQKQAPAGAAPKPQKSPVPGVSDTTWNGMSPEAQAAMLNKLSKAELKSFNEKTRGAVAQWVMNNKGKTALVGGVALALGLDYALQPSDQPWDVGGAAERTAGRAWDLAKQAWSADYRPGGASAPGGANAPGGGGAGGAAGGSANNWGYDPSQDTIPHYSTRRDLWQLKPGEDWADPYNRRTQPTNESQYQLFVRHPNTGELVEIDLSNTKVDVHTIRQNYFESYNLSESQGRTWTVSTWLNYPISKLLKGKE